MFAVMWKDLECIMLSEASQREENKYCMLSLCGLKRKVKQLNIYVKTEKDSHILLIKKQTSGYQRGEGFGEGKIGICD